MNLPRFSRFFSFSRFSRESCAEDTHTTLAFDVGGIHSAARSVFTANARRTSLARARVSTSRSVAGKHFIFSRDAATTSSRSKEARARARN
jgi:hypothetical protein